MARRGKCRISNPLAALFFSSSLCSFITDLTSTSHADCSTHRYIRLQRCLLSPKLSTMKVAAQQHACLRHPCQLAGICHDGCQAIHNVSVPAPSYALFCLDTGHGGHQCCETRCARTSAGVVDSVGGLHLQLLPCPGGEWVVHCSPRFTVCIVHEQLCRQTSDPRPLVDVCTPPVRPSLGVRNSLVSITL